MSNEPNSEEESNPEPSRPLDDYFSILWLGGIGIATMAVVGGGAYLVMTGAISFDVALTGTVDVGQIINGTLVPLFWLITVVAVIELFGKKKVRSLLDNWGGAPPRREGDDE